MKKQSCISRCNPIDALVNNLFSKNIFLTFIVLFICKLYSYRHVQARVCFHIGSYQLYAELFLFFENKQKAQ